MVDHICVRCGGETFQSKGVVVRADGIRVQRVKCKSCGKHASLEIEEKRKDKISEIDRTFVEDVTPLAGHSKYVVTCAQNDTPIHEEFLESLECYCELNNAKLMVIPVRYKNPSAYSRPVNDTWDKRLVKYMMDKTLDCGMFKIMGDLKIQATMQSPLNGLDPLTQGKTTIVGHSQIQLRSCPRLRSDSPIILTTTGSITKPEFSDTRAGFIANFHHSLGAVVVEVDGEQFHLRHLVADDDGTFVDLGLGYSGAGCWPTETKALVLGDEHAWFSDDDNFNAVFGSDGIVEDLKPEYLVRHDIFDAASVSHHHENNFFVKYKKKLQSLTLENELVQCAGYIKSTTPEGCTSVIVGSNHNSHLMKWLQETRSSFDMDNSYMNAKLKLAVMDHIHEYGVIPDVFELAMTDLLKGMGFDSFMFVNDSNSFKINGIELALHGDKGPNGSRGSAKSLAKLSHRSVIGHSHSPAIERGCYQVGTSTGFDLEYTSGITSWMNTHCAIYENGKRQLIHVINGRWRA